jgi:tetratricopeptide (TPR) repeat protein
VPGLLDLPQTDGRWEQFGEGVASACIVAMGSDGPRSWFLVVDSLTPRAGLSDQTAGDLMFLAGEIGSIILHRDARAKTASPVEAASTPSSDENHHPGFAGWPILKDLEEIQNDEVVGQRIRNRFLVTRVIRGLVDDHLVTDGDSLAYQIKNVREELGSVGSGGPEEEAWGRVLDSASAGDYSGLMAGMLEWGRVVDGQGHGNGALEILSLAFDVAQAVGSAAGAVDAARFKGKVYRVRAEWDQAMAWYDVAQRVAVEAGQSGKLPLVLDGLANTFRDLGNLPKAREVLGQVLDIGQERGDSYVRAIAHHDLMTVEKLANDLVPAIQHGWKAVQAYDSSDGKLKALFDLAGVLRESGELSAARNAYSIVADRMVVFEYKLLALDALAYIAAIMDEADIHDELRRRMDHEGWEALSPVYRGQVLYYRGLACEALGREPEGEGWLREALVVAEEHGLNKLIFDIERELARYEETKKAPPPAPEWTPEPCGDALLGVRQGLEELLSRPLAEVL